MVRQQHEQSDMSDTGPLPSIASSGMRTWELRCTECGESWEVTTAMILSGDGWMRCPTCGSRPSSTGDESRRRSE